MLKCRRLAKDTWQEGDLAGKVGIGWGEGHRLGKRPRCGSVPVLEKKQTLGWVESVEGAMEGKSILAENVGLVNKGL